LSRELSAESDSHSAMTGRLHPVEPSEPRLLA
jgi:hypothetical protein